MKLFMLQYEVDRMAAMFAAVLGMPEPKVKAKEREPVKLKNGVATIQIKGPLYPKINSWMDYWGEDYTVYSDIIADVAEAQYKGAKSIDFEIDSPGGYVDGLYDAMQAIASVDISTRTIAGKTLASAAYMLASQTGEIIVESPASSVGSIGIATWAYISDSIVDITNSDSKKKRPDVSTDEGKKVVVDELDDFWAIYAENMAVGRKTTVENIKKNYGQGAVMTARTALSKGMIDGIMPQNQPAKSKAAAIGAKSMDLEQLKAEYPGLYAQVFALGEAAGSKKGSEKERDRVEAHLIAAENGDVEAAHKAILAGDEYGPKVEAKHQAFARNKSLIAARAADNPPDINTNGDAPVVTAFAKEKAEIEEGCDGLEWGEA
jgi:ClpP class serine protease